MEKLDLVLNILIALFALNIIMNISRVIYENYRDNKKLYRRINKDISRGNFSDGLQACELGLKKKPYDSQLLWLEADALFRLKQYKQAKIKFEYIAENEPVWKEDADKYIESINSKI